MRTDYRSSILLHWLAPTKDIILEKSSVLRVMLPTRVMDLTAPCPTSPRGYDYNDVGPGGKPSDWMLATWTFGQHSGNSYSEASMITKIF